MEIDENSQIIALVQTRPILYSKCNDFRERNHQWKEIADILKVDVSWVKSRWHILRAKFLTEYSAALKGRRSNFKYFNEMSFLVDHINIEAFDMHKRSCESDTQPEFIITQKDLDEQSDDDSTNIFVELEIDNGSNKEMIPTFDLSNEISEDELEGTLYMPSEELSEGKQLATQTKYKINSQSQVETFHIIEVSENTDCRTEQFKDDSRVSQSEEVSKPSSEELGKCDISVPEQKISAESSNKVSAQAEANQSGSSKSEKHRCEDTIFGELVTATLRKMQTEKKRAVKREIMNILFT